MARVNAPTASPALDAFKDWADCAKMGSRYCYFSTQRDTPWPNADGKNPLFRLARKLYQRGDAFLSRETTLSNVFYFIERCHFKTLARIEKIGARA